MDDIVGIIGSGMIGGNVARLAVAAGIDVVICNSRGPETLAELIAELGPNARAGTLAEVTAASDLIVLAVPFGIYATLPVDSLAEKIVIDTLNYYPQRDGMMLEVRTDSISTSELLQRHLVKSRVIRAINNMDFVRLLTSARPAGAPDRSALPIAGDSAQDKARVAALLDRIGYDAVDMGLLAESWRSEPTMPVYVSPYQRPGLSYQGIDADGHSFMTAPGQIVDVAQVDRLLKQAVRHDRMFGGYPSRTNAAP